MTLSSGLMFLGFGCGIYFLYQYTKETERKMTWWKWALIVVWALCVYLAAGVVGTFAGEGASRAVTSSGVFFLVLALVSGVGVWRIVFYKKKDSAAVVQAPPEETV